MYTHILVAVDGSDPSKQALAEAIRLARQQSAQLKLIHVVDQTLRVFEERGWLGNEAMQKTLLKATSDAGVKILEDAVQVCQAAGITAQTEMPKIISESIGDKILTEAEQWPADLIVIGTHGRRGIQKVMLGSVAEAVAKRATVPVMLIRAK